MLLIIFSLVQKISLKISERPLTWHAKYSIPVSLLIAGLHSRDQLPCFSTETKEKQS